jgi:phosphoribosyl-AMP cyclohydrolase
MSAEPAVDREVAALSGHDADGLVTAVVQPHETGSVRVLAWLDDEAPRCTLTIGRATCWSHGRGEYWVEGETSVRLAGTG